jgi:hypothetical protein
MKTTKQTILHALREQPTSWIKSSAANPNAYMSRICILLHYVVLRERGEL